MPPLRRRANPHPTPSPQELLSSSDDDYASIGASSEDDDEPPLLSSEDHPQLLSEEEDDVDDEPPAPSSPTNHSYAYPPHLREISTLASWTVSSSKPGCSIPQLRHPSPSLYWQSDGPQPHHVNIHFFKLVRIVALRLYLDFRQDESYTPTRIVLRAGCGLNDLVEWGEMRLDSPRGWVWADFGGVGDAEGSDEEEEEELEEVDVRVGRAPREQDVQRRFAGESDVLEDSSDHENTVPLPQPGAFETPTQQGHDGHHAGVTPSLPHPRVALAPLSPDGPLAERRSASPRRKKMPVLRCHLVQIKILENHQNGKDTHLRGLQIFARADDKDGGREVGRVDGGMARREAGMGEGMGRAWMEEVELR